MHESVHHFVKSIISPLPQAKGRVLEVGSQIVPGQEHMALRKLFTGCKEYVGVDIIDGGGVDHIGTASDYYGEDFDCVIATEMLEHALDWADEVHAMKLALKVDGVLCLTTRSYGFPYHNPPDYWRFSPPEICAMFADLLILTVADDPQVPGVFFAGQKKRTTGDYDYGHITPFKVPANYLLD